MKRQPRRVHAQRRAKSRFGLRLTLRELDHLAREIREGRALAVIRKNASRWFCLLAYQERVLPVVYSRSRRKILTVLPVNCDQMNDLVDQALERMDL